ncbi:MAG: hypothetical protein JW904_15255 [Spirochaetales bacterium]|nr:hypothetical protein [Spirochaetales bacterium]
MSSLAEITAKANAAAKKQGSVSYMLKGMFLPEGEHVPGPYVNKDEFPSALDAANEKIKILKESTNPSARSASESFLMLRDGGTDTQGEPGKTVMTGWLTHAAETLGSAAFIEGMKKLGDRIAHDFSALVVIGIGGSYTDIEGTITACTRGKPEIPVFYLGQHLSAEQYAAFFETAKALPGKLAVNIISKSGTTTEPAIAARIVIEGLTGMDKCGAIFATTDPQKGALHDMIGPRGFNPPEYITDAVKEKFSIGENIGGRFSSITPVGLFPFAVAGVDIEELLLGYHYGITGCEDIVAQNTACRFLAFQEGAVVGVYSYNVACFRGKILGFRQLWPESTGKDGKGLNIMEEFYTSDAHSNGQLIKSGVRNIMEIFHFIGDIGQDFEIPKSAFDKDNLNMVAGNMSLHAINNRFMSALFLDHIQSGVPAMAVRLPSLSAFHIGMHTAIEHYSAAVFGLLTGINPVNQPGVQGYKNIAFNLLGMKGAEGQKQAAAALGAFGF